MKHLEGWEPVIGLEIHVQLSTKSKHLQLGSQIALATSLTPTSIRSAQDNLAPFPSSTKMQLLKQSNLAAPSEPKSSPFSANSTENRTSIPIAPATSKSPNFTIRSSSAAPSVAEVEGKIMTFAINHAHLEDDAGMLKHFTSFAGVDYNRAGVPLIEIVSEPCIHSPKEAVAYAMAINAIMHYLDASDCNMEEGSLRIDANISVRLRGEKKLRNKIEIKNMNSFSNMELAIDKEIERQIEIYEANPDAIIRSGTYRFNVETGENILMREKEMAEDYRYFPEPDLLPLILTDEYIETIRAALPELPHQRFKRYTEELGLSLYNASLLIADKKLCDFFEQGLEYTKNAKNLCNWITVEFIGRLKEKNLSLEKSGIASSHIANLVAMIDDGTITGRMAKEIADEMVASPGKDPREIAANNPKYKPLEDLSAIEPIVDAVLQANPQSIADYKEGRTKALAFLVGQIMKQTKGMASPEIVNRLLLDKISKL